MDPWWNPAVERQAQDRIHRIGQHKPTRCFILLTNLISWVLIMLLFSMRILTWSLYLQNREICYWEYNWGEDSEAARKEGINVWSVSVSFVWQWGCDIGPNQYCVLQDHMWLFWGPRKINWGRLEISVCYLKMKLLAPVQTSTASSWLWMIIIFQPSLGDHYLVYVCFFF
jgi:hypothetical protein